MGVRLNTPEFRGRSSTAFIVLGCIFLLWAVQAHAQGSIYLGADASPNTVKAGQSVIFSSTTMASHPPLHSEVAAFTVTLAGVPVAGFQDNDLRLSSGHPMKTSFVWQVPSTATPGSYSLNVNIYDEKGITQATAQANFTVSAAVAAPTAVSSSARNVEIAAADVATSARDRPGRGVPFVALHTYYLAATQCSDRNSGTSPDLPWCSPNHSVNCGDVIITAAGHYTSNNFGTGTWGTVSNCPSTSGGIANIGGIYFAVVLCSGPNMSACSINGGANEAVRIGQSNWAIEGFTATQNSNGNGACYTVTSDTPANINYTAFVNDIASSCDLSGFDSYAYSTNGQSDDTAVVGVISYNGSPSQSGGGICASGVSLIPGETSDTTADTHVFVAGYFGYKNINAQSGEGCNTDGEGLIFDSLACGKFAQRVVAEQNIWWLNGGPGFEVYPNWASCGDTNDKAQYYIFSNTSYNNFQDPKHTGNIGELAMQNLYPTATSVYTVTNNIFVAAQKAVNGNNIVAGEWWCSITCASYSTGGGNYIFQSNPGTKFTAGNFNTDVWSSASSHDTTTWPYGTNTYNDPGFANPIGLPSGTPNCSGYTSVTACMNTGYGVYADLTPSGGAAGRGYQPPGPCTADSYYPTWLRGIVYLQWNGSTLTEEAGLITKPCDM